MSDPAVTMGDVSDLVRGVTYDKAASRLEPQAGYLPLLRATNINEGQVLFDSFVFVPEEAVSEVQRVRHNDIILAASSGSLSVVGKAALVRKSWSGTFGAFCYVIRPKSDLVLPEFLGHFMQSSAYRRRVSELAAGVNINNLRREHVLGTPVPYVSLAQQRRIVDTLDSMLSRLDAAVASLEAAQRKLKAYRASVLKAAVEGRLMPTEAELARKEDRSYEPADVLLERILNERRRRWEEAELAKMKAAGKTPKDDSWKTKYNEPRVFDVSVLRSLPEGWRWTTVQCAAWSVKDGPHYSPAYCEDGVPFITGGHVRPWGIDFEAARRISPELHAELCERVRPELGDLLYTKGGTTGIARVNTYARDFSVWVHVAVLKLVPSINAFYLQHALNSPYCYSQAQRFTHGVGNQDLGLTRMISILVPLPPRTEQDRIVNEVDRLDSVGREVETAIHAQRIRVQRLRQAVLTWAFAGKLVDQDPADEPADVLVARIRAARVAVPPTTPKAKRSRKLKAAS